MGRRPGSFEGRSASSTARGYSPGGRAGSPSHAAGTADPVARPVGRHGHLPHAPPKGGAEAPAEAHLRRQAPKGTTAEEIGRGLHARA